MTYRVTILIWGDFTLEGTKVFPPGVLTWVIDVEYSKGISRHHSKVINLDCHRLCA